MAYKTTAISNVRACTLFTLTAVLSLFAFGPAVAQKSAASTYHPISNAASKSDWSTLTTAQQQALAPLAADWDSLDSAHKRKWLVIGNKFASMKPEERSRIQNRMREWVKLSPQQRHIARENYWRTKKIDPNQKNVHWQEYQQLPEEQKKKLAAAAASKKRGAALSKAHKNNDGYPIRTKKVPMQTGQTENKDSSTLPPSVAPSITK